MNTVDHSTFQDQITNYLGGTPDTAYTWFSGFRMKFFADQGLNVADRRRLGARSRTTTPRASRKSVVGNDGKVYGIPVDYYPWAVFYRKSVFADEGLHRPDDLGRPQGPVPRRCRRDGLTPIAFGDKDGWPAMGTFDILNLRLNGYDFHVGLMAGKEKWTDPKVTAVFQKWAEILPFHAKDYAGLTWQNAADTLVQKKSGHVPARPVRLRRSSPRRRIRPTSPTSTSSRSRPSARSTTPRARSTRRSTPGRSRPSHRTSRPRRTPPRRYLEFWAKGSTQVIIFKNQPGASRRPRTPTPASYTDLQKKAVEIVSKASGSPSSSTATRAPDFAGSNGMQSFLQKFLANPTQDLAAYQKTIQDFWDSLPPPSIRALHLPRLS